MPNVSLTMDYTTADGRKLPVNFTVPSDKVKFDEYGTATGGDEDYIKQTAQMALESRYPNEAGKTPSRTVKPPVNLSKPYHPLGDDAQPGQKGYIPVLSPAAASFRNAVEAPISGKSWQGRTADALEGAGTVLTAGFAPEIGAAPVTALKAIPPMAALGYGGQAAATVAGAEPDTARMVGDVGGFLGAGLAGSPKVREAIPAGIKEGINRVQAAKPSKLGGVLGDIVGALVGARSTGGGDRGLSEYAGFRIGHDVGANAHPIEFGKGFFKGATRAAAQAPWFPKLDNFTPKEPQKPSPVAASPTAPPVSPTALPSPKPPIVNPPSFSSVRPAIEAPPSQAQLPPAPVSTEPKLLGPATQIQMPAGQPLPPTAAPTPVTPKFPVKAPQPVAAAPVQAPVAPIAPPAATPKPPLAPPVVAPKPPEPIVPTAPVAPPQDQSAAMKALGVEAKPTAEAPKAEPKTPLSPPIKPTEAKPAEPKYPVVPRRVQEANDLYTKNPEGGLYVFGEGRLASVDQAQNLLGTDKVTTQKILDTWVEQGNAKKLKSGQYQITKEAYKAKKPDLFKPKEEPVTAAPEKPVKPERELTAPTDAELKELEDEEVAKVKARKVNPPSKKEQAGVDVLTKRVNPPGEKADVSTEEAKEIKSVSAEQQTKDAKVGDKATEKPQDAPAVVKKYDKKSLGFTDNAHVDRAFHAALGKTKLGGKGKSEFLKTEYNVDSSDDLSTNQKLAIIERVLGKELKPEDAGKPFPASEFSKDSKTGKYGFGF